MIALWVALAMGAYQPQQAGSPPLADPGLEARVQAIGKRLRCTVCQGMSIADSPAQTARAEMSTVRRLVSEGKTDPEVYGFFVARYGDWALLEPPKEGFSLLVWLGPAIALLGGFLFILLFVRSRNQGPPPPPPKPPEGKTDDEYLKLVRAETER